MERAFAGEGSAHLLPHHGVRITERQTSSDQPLGQVSRSGIGRCSLGRHGLGVERGGGDHAVEGEQRESDRVDGVEQRLLVLLHVLVVGERQSLEGGEETGEVTDESACLAPCEFGDIGVLLLGHHRRPGREPVVKGHESELRRCPQDPFLADTAQVHPEQR